MSHTRVLLLLSGLAVLLACGGRSGQRQAELMLEKARRQAELRQYDRALITIDSLRKEYPGAVDVRRRALRLQQELELSRSQEELAVVDSALEAVKRDYAALLQQVEHHKAQLQATPGELTLLTRTRMRRDSLQTRFNALCAKIRYIHKKQKEE